MPGKIQLHIPEPCHENWEAMTPVEKGRFCGSCQKQVVDFSVMSDREMAQFFKKPPSASVCGHFSNHQLDRDIALPKKRLPWIKYFFQVALPAFLLSTKAEAQIKGQIKVETTCVPDQSRTRGMVARIPDQLTGKVIDENGNPIYNARVYIKSSTQYLVTDAKGIFTIKTPLTRSEDELTVTCVGYSATNIKISATDWRRGTITVIMDEPMMSGEVVITKPIKKKPLLDTLKNVFTASKISPNPVQQGNAFIVEWKARANEKTYVRVADKAGKLLLFVPFDVVKGDNNLPVNTDKNWEPGEYTVELLSAGGKQLINEKVKVIAVEIDSEVIKGLVAVKVQKPVATETPKNILPAFSNTASKINPNPVLQGQTFTVNWKGESTERAVIKITSIEGKELMTIPVDLLKGDNRFAVNTDNNWLPGFYIVTLSTNNKQLLSEKIVIQ